MNNQFGLNTGMNTGFNVSSGFNYVGNNANETLNNINSWQTSTKQKYSDAKTNEIAQQGQNMFECAVRTDDGQVRKMNLSGANLNNMAILIKQTSNAQGYHSYDDLDANQIVCRYLQKNPHRFQVTQDTLDGTISLNDWASVVGIKTGEDYGVGKTNTEEGGNFFTNVLKNYVEPFYQHGGQAISNLINGSLQEIEQGTVFNPSATDYTDSALENYARINYGTNFYGLTDEQKEEARQAVATDEGMDIYKPTVQRVLSRGAEAGLDAYYAIAGMPIMVLNSVGAEIPYVRDVIEGFGSLLQFGGYLINKLPLLKQFRDSLQTEEEKEERDQYVAGFGLWKLGGKKANNKIKGAEKGIGKIAVKLITDPKEVINSFKEMPKKIAEKLPDQGEVLASMNELTPGEKAIFKVKYGENHGDFLNRNGIIDGEEGTIIKLHALKNNWFDQITNALEEIKGDFDVNNVWMKEMVDESVGRAKRTLEKNPDVVEKLQSIQDKFNSTGKLNASEIKYLMRYYAEKVKLGYDKEFNSEKIDKATNVYSVALDMLTKIAEDNGFDNMSDISRNIQKSTDIINALGKDIAKKYGKGNLDLADYLQIYGDLNMKGLTKFTIKKIFTSDWAKKNYVYIINKLKGIQPEVIFADLDKIREISSKNTFDKWVKEIENESKTPKLGENPQYSNNPVDYTSPTRGTPEGEAAQYGQILETKKNTGLEDK